MNGKLLKVTFKMFGNYTLTFEDTEEKNYGTNALVQYKNSKNEDLLITIANPDNPNELIMFYPHSVVDVNVEDGGEPVEMVTITFADPDGYATSVPDPVELRKGYEVAEGDLPSLVATDPTIIFDSWWTAGYSNKVEIGDIVNADLTIYAKWSLDGNVEVHYVDELGVAREIPHDFTTEIGHVLIEAELPELESTLPNFVFEGWYDKHSNHQYVAGDVINSTTFIYAKFRESRMFTITYRDEEGLAIDLPSAKSVPSGYIIRREDIVPLTTTIEGYVFDKYVHGDVDVTEGYEIVADVVFDARWKRNLTISYIDPSGHAESLPSSKTVEAVQIGIGFYEYVLTESDVPTLASSEEGYIFDYWIDREGNRKDAETAITEDTELQAVWIDEHITISYFDREGYAVSVPLPKRVLVGYTLTADDLPSVDSRDPNKFFLGWYDYEGTTQYHIGDNVIENTSIFAKFVDGITLSFVDEYGIASETRDSKLVAPGYALTADDVSSLSTDLNYGFDGWWNHDKTFLYIEGSTIDEDTTLYAEWDAESVTIKYADPSGYGASLPSDKTEMAGYELIASDIAPLTTSEMFTFEGWFNAAYDDEYEVGDKVQKDITLYAKWSPIEKVTITYVDPGNVADSMPINHEVYPGHELEATEVPELTTSIPDIEFYGWYNADNTIHYEEGYEITEDTILYAIFRPSINIIYNDADGYAVELPSNREVPARHYIVPEDVPFIESNDDTKIFAGWFTQDGSDRYEVGEYMDSINDVNVYAHWVDKEEINIYYYSKPTAGGLRHLYDKIWYKNAPITSDILAPFEPYYTADGMKHSFIEWQNSSSVPYKYGDVLTADTSIYSEEIDEGPFDVVKVSYSTVETVEIPSDIYVPRGSSMTSSMLIPKVYEFESEGRKRVFTGMNDAYGNRCMPGMLINEDITLNVAYMIMQVSENLLMYIDESGIYSETNSAIRAISVESGYALTREDLTPLTLEDGDIHIFVGWAYENGTIANVGELINDDTVLHAVWSDTPSSLYVTYIDNSGYATSVPPQESHRYKDVISPLPVITSADANYRFVGWFNADFSKQYQAPLKVINNIALYAKFINVNSVLISYVDNELHNVVASKEVAVGLPIDASYLPSLPRTIINRTSFTLDGWYDETQSIKYEVGNMFDRDTTFYAKWEPHHIGSIFYDDPEHLADWMPSNKIDIDVPYTLVNDDLPTLTTSNITKQFDYWSKDGAKVNVGDVIEANETTLVAVWKEKSSGGPLTFTAVAPNSSVKYKTGGLPTEYSLDGTTWNEYTSETNIALPNVDDYVMFKSIGHCSNARSFSMTGKISASGSVQSLVGDDTVISGEFRYMFKNCTSLVTAPELPATNLDSSCYFSMFEGCSSLVTAPELPATNLASYCYAYIFWKCTSLVNAPELPANNLASYCYFRMFEGCTSLINAPELHATNLEYSCYGSMFWGCTSLVTAPELPAMNLISSCYYSMFRGCTSLVNAPELPANNLAEYCYQYMFNNCTSLVTAPELPANNLEANCYYHMFEGCTSLINAPELHATNLANHCYEYMFQGCTSLVNAPELPANNLASYCYQHMFDNCTSLVTAPELPANNLKDYCYCYMFDNCTSLNYVKCAFNSWTPINPTTAWLRNVSPTGTFVCPTALPEERGTSKIPNGWTIERF